MSEKVTSNVNAKNPAPWVPPTIQKVGAVGDDRRADYVSEVRAVRIDDVVVPVGLQEPPVVLEVAAVCGVSVRAVENCEEIRQQVDQHSIDRSPTATLGRKSAT